MIEPLLEARAERGFGAGTLRVVQVGGAVASPSRKARLMDELDCVVLDVYGLTECSWPVGHSLSSPRQEMLETTDAICRTAELKVIDGDGHAVPDGTQGEIALRGPTLFPGYFANEKATRAAIDADGWFRSGDLGILTPQRYVRISGREKDVISHGGITIAPEEIEEWLFRFPKVRAAAAFGVPDAAKGEVIWACVEPVDSDDPPTEEEVRRYLKSKIASFKVPTRVIVVPSLPTSSVGKVQRAELKRKMAGPHL
jgi:non-ribosomal peptide synthetase component E (peptide arylation enzyme)